MPRPTTAEELSAFLARPLNRTAANPTPQDIRRYRAARRALRSTTRTELAMNSISRKDEVTALGLLHNPRLSSDELRPLARTESPSVLVGLALHPSTPHDIVRDLLRPHMPEIVRMAVASRNDLTDDLSNTLGNDRSDKVRHVVTNNLAIPDEMRVLAALRSGMTG